MERSGRTRAQRKELGTNVSVTRPMHRACTPAAETPLLLHLHVRQRVCARYCVRFRTKSSSPRIRELHRASLSEIRRRNFAKVADELEIKHDERSSSRKYISNGIDLFILRMLIRGTIKTCDRECSVTIDRQTGISERALDRADFSRTRFLRRFICTRDD